MEIETLKVSHVKRNIIIGVVAVFIISAIVLNFTRAKYRVTDSIEIVNGTVNYTPYDFKMIAMYQKEDGEYVEIESMPSSGYTINEEMSYCTLDNVNHDNEAILYTNANGEHVISGLKKNSKCYLYFDEVTTRPVETTLLGTIQVNLDEPNFANTSCTSKRYNGTARTCGEETVGIYEETTSRGTTYYWRGDVENNYLVFADKYWRIIRINEDGTLRIIYSGEKSEVDAAGKETVLANGYNDSSTDYTQTQTSAFNSSSFGSYYVGYRYTSGSQRPSSTSSGTNSTIKEILETWYSNNLQSYDSQIASSASTGFCNDRNPQSGDSWVSSGTDFYYAAYERYSNREPSFECNNSLDLYTTKIGLITADEVMYAGGGSVNYGYYLYTGNVYWTLSPYTVFANGAALVFGVHVSGEFLSNGVTAPNGVRPVISLSTNNTITGSGTINDPYVVS